MKYFKEKEFLMDGVIVFDKMDSDLLYRLDLLREVVSEPLYISSSYRSKEKNNSVGGSKNSFHLLGRAIDLACVDGASKAKIIKCALELGFTVGISKTFIHIDNRDSQIVFTY